MMKVFISSLTFVTLFLITISCEKEVTQNEAVVAHSGIEIGRVINDNFEITYDVPTLKKAWAYHINQSPDLNVQLSSISIEEDETGVFLFGVDEISGTKSRFNLVLQNGIVYHPLKDNSRNDGTTVSCTGCKSTGPNSGQECVPKSAGNSHWCTSCTKGDGVKSVTSGGIF